MVFKRPKKAPAILLKIPNPATLDKVVKDFARTDIPTTTIINVSANDTICMVLGDQETCELIIDCVRDENFSAT